MAFVSSCYQLITNQTQHRWAGGYWWIWRSDPTEGGTSDSSFTPRGKPAETVLRRWYGNLTSSGSYASITSAIRERQQQFSAISPSTSDAAPPFRFYGDASNYQNGWVFGSGEWTYPGYRLDSQEAIQSLRDAAATGANSVEFVVMWYVVLVSIQSIVIDHDLPVCFH